MADPHPLAAEIAQLNAMERHIIDRFIHRQRVARDITAAQIGFGDRLADRVAAFGGSWAFILLAVAAICVWMVINVMLNKEAFDPYPYILLNLAVLHGCVAGTDHYDEPEPPVGARPNGRATRLRGQYEG